MAAVAQCGTDRYSCIHCGETIRLLRYCVNFDSMEKEWYASKGVWGGTLVMLGAVGSAILKGTIDIEVIQAFGVGLSALGIRVAIK